MQRFLGVLLIAWLAAAGSAAATNLQVSPIMLVLEPAQRAVQLNLTNTGDRSLLVQIDAYAWSQPDGKDVLIPTQALVVSPPVVDIPAGSQQVIRVGLRRDKTPSTEQTYRVMVTEIPTDENAYRTALRLAVRLSLPLFVQPATKAEPTLDVTRATDGIRLRNAGTAHLKLRSLRVQPADGSWHDVPVPPASYVLPGAERVLPLPDAAWVDQRLQVEVQHAGNDTTLTAVVPAAR